MRRGCTGRRGASSTNVRAGQCPSMRRRVDSRVLGVEQQHQDKHDDGADRQTGAAQPERNATFRVSSFPVHGGRVARPAGEDHRQRT